MMELIVPIITPFKEEPTEAEQQRVKHKEVEDEVTTPKDSVVYVRNKKLFRMEKNKRHLRIIGNGNRVVITCNTGHLEIIGNSNSVWIVRNSGSLQFTGNHGRIFLGHRSDQRTVDYVGSDGRVTVRPECDLLERAEDKETSHHLLKDNIKCHQKTYDFDNTFIPKEDDEDEAFKDIVITKDYLIPICYFAGMMTRRKNKAISGSCFVQVTSEITIRTSRGKT